VDLRWQQIVVNDVCVVGFLAFEGTPSHVIARQGVYRHSPNGYLSFTALLQDASCKLPQRRQLEHDEEDNSGIVALQKIML